MPIPDFVVALREKIGHEPLWLPGSTAVVLRRMDDPGAAIDGAAAEELEVLLVHRSDNGNWAPVTGIVDPGEHPAVTAAREAQEEARVEIEVERLTLLSVTEQVVHANGDHAQYLDLTFRCRWIAGEGEVGDDESTEVRWYPVEALPPMRADLAYRIRSAVAGGPECELLTGRQIRTASA